MVTRYLFYSHDGYGLGHVRRNSLIARAVLDTDPDAQVSLVTGLDVRPRWLEQAERVRVHRVPSMLKASDGSYRPARLSFADALRERERIFLSLVDDERPDVVVVDRHPYGTAGELRTGLDLARRRGSALVLGLRDVLDDASVVREELRGLGWAGVEDVYDEVLVYGGCDFIDHEAEYGLTLPLHHCGWVAERRQSHATRTSKLLVVAAGGGGDGAAVFELGAQRSSSAPTSSVSSPRPVRRRRGDAPAQPAGTRSSARRQPPGRERALVLARRGDPVHGGLQLDLEALAAGRRPILVPRRSPRREQAIRRAAGGLGLADVVEPAADPAEVAALLQRSPADPAPGRPRGRRDRPRRGAHAARRLHALVEPRGACDEPSGRPTGSRRGSPR